MRKVVLLGAFLVTSMMSAQDMEVVKGNFDFLKDQKEINVEFDYSKITLMKEKKTEAQYVEERSKDLNDKNKGVGDVWKKKWESSKQLIWTPKFIELVNTVLTKKKQDLNFQEDLKSAKYTLIVEAVWFYPGWNIGFTRNGAKVTTNLKFVETSNRNNVVLEITSENAPGDSFGGTFSNEDRIGEGFAKTGKSLAGLILKKLK